MLFSSPFTAFLALVVAVVAAAPDGKTQPGAATATVAASPTQHLHALEASSNSSYGLKARGLRIQFGETATEEVVWASGDSQCSAVVLTAKGLNPCSRPFSLHGVGGLTLEGCGGPLWINQNGAFYETCVSFTEPEFCGVHTEWTCL